MSGSMAEFVGGLLLLASLAFAVIRPFGLAEAVVAVPAALLTVALGITTAGDAWRTAVEIGPTVGFLAAILVFGHLCAQAGVFDYLGAVAAGRAKGSPRRLLVLVVVLAAVVTATLTLDATVVLVTPVVLAAASRVGAANRRPFAYATIRLANSASLLLPVSNLTNLLAFEASGLSFVRFAELMALPWVLVCVAEWAALRWWFRRDFALGAPADNGAETVVTAPRYALVVAGLTVASFAIGSAFGVALVWCALGGCVALVIPRLLDRTASPRQLVAEASLGFCLFVLALSVIVDGVVRHGAGDLLRTVVPDGASWPALVVIAATAAVLANLVNNLPATLALIPLVAGRPELVLAVLIGVNVGPNLAYPGSLATLLWRRVLPSGLRPRAGEFHAFGLLTVPVLLLAATTALWASFALWG